MIFVDANVWMYAVGGAHPLREDAQSRLTALHAGKTPVVTSSEVLQEFMHAYLPVRRLETLDAALRLADDLATVWPVEAEDVRLARDLHGRHPGLSARDLVHLGVCRRRGAIDLLTYDRGLTAAWSG